MAKMWTRLLGRTRHAGDVERAVTLLSTVAAPRGLPVALLVYSDGTRALVGVAASRAEVTVSARADYAEACTALGELSSSWGQFTGSGRSVWWAIVDSTR